MSVNESDVETLISALQILAPEETFLPATVRVATNSEIISTMHLHSLCIQTITPLLMF